MMVKMADLKYLVVILAAAFAYNFGLTFFTEVPAGYQLNSDTTSTRTSGISPRIRVS
jgi:hypothetical protein